jgi:hypothetical protein
MWPMQTKTTVTAYGEECQRDSNTPAIKQGMVQARSIYSNSTLQLDKWFSSVEL